MLQEQACHEEETSFIGPTIDFQSLTEVQLIELLEMEFSVKISRHDALTILHDLHNLVEKNAQTENNNHTWVSKQSRNTLLIWLKNRLRENGYFPSTATEDDTSVSLTTELNIGFIGIVETEAMKELLRQNSDEDDEEEKDPEVARSKIFKEMTRNEVNPIDRVAKRVAAPLKHYMKERYSITL